MNNDLISRSALEKDYRRQFESVYKNIRDTVMPSDFYITRKAAYDKELIRLEMEAFCEYLQARPTIDAVEVVRCRDCVNREISPINPQRMYCHGLDVSLPTNLDFYCARGVKMDAEVKG